MWITFSLTGSWCHATIGVELSFWRDIELLFRAKGVTLRLDTD